MQVKGPFLVVGPLSTLSNWYREFQRFTPDIPVVLYHGSKQVFAGHGQHVAHFLQDRAEMRRGIMQPDEKLGANQTVITSYQIAMNDRVHLAVRLQCCHESHACPELALEVHRRG